MTELVGPCDYAAATLASGIGSIAFPIRHLSPCCVGCGIGTVGRGRWVGECHDVFNAYYLTNFADQAVLLPLAVCVGLTFAIAGWRRGAIAWTVAVGGTFLVTLSLKLIFLACGHLLPFPGIRSPSGHTAAAAVVYGSLLARGIRRVTGHARWTIPSALLVALVIGASRLTLGLHTGREVLLGGAIGVGGAVVAALGAGAAAGAAAGSDAGSGRAEHRGVPPRFPSAGGGRDPIRGAEPLAPVVVPLIYL